MNIISIRNPLVLFSYRSSSGVFKSLPVIPDHTIRRWAGIAVMIDAIQVGVETPVVPPGSMILTGTVEPRILIIILKLHAEQLIIVPTERVTSSS